MFETGPAQFLRER